MPDGRHCNRQGKLTVPRIFDLVHEALQILIHSPHRRTSTVTGRMVWSESNREIATLNINQSVTALAAGILVPSDERDVLIVGNSR